MSARARLAVPAVGLVAGGLMTGGLVLGTAAPALAAYPPTTPVCSQATSTNKPSAPVTITGVGFPPGATVTVTGTGAAVVTTPTTVVDKTGALKVVEKLGATPGTGQFLLSGTVKNSKCSAVSVAVKGLTVTRPTTVTNVSPTQVKGSLAFTGAAGIGIMSALGLGLVGAGTVAVVATRRRKNAPVA